MRLFEKTKPFIPQELAAKELEASKRKGVARRGTPTAFARPFLQNKMPRPRPGFRQENRLSGRRNNCAAIQMSKIKDPGHVPLAASVPGF